jgi:predicted NBD/HSP70 family sugar kinase
VEAGNQPGIAIASLVNLFNPDIVVVGGGVVQALSTALHKIAA